MSNDNHVAKLHPNHEDCPFVSKETCAIRTRASKWVTGVFFGVLSIFFALMLYASDQAHDANAQYIDIHNTVSKHEQDVNIKVQAIKSEFDTYRAEKKAVDRSIIEKLDEVKMELCEQRKEQRILLEKILEIQIEVARKPGM